MKRLAQAALAVVFLGTLTGCGLFTSAGKIDASVLEDPIEKVTARHDAYTKADESLTELERAVFLRTAELLRQVVREAQGK